MGIGAFGFGLVVGWASAFTAASVAGMGFRLLFAVAAIASLAGFGAGAITSGGIGLAAGMFGHEALIAALERRVR